MSFSGEIKDEIANQLNFSRHCQLAELAVILQYCTKIQKEKDMPYQIRIQTENEAVARKCFTLLKKTFNISTDIISTMDETLGKGRLFYINIEDSKEALNILQALKQYDTEGIRIMSSYMVHPTLIKNACCRRAFLRGAYLTIGSMSDPEKAYHLEFVCAEEGQANQIKEVLREFGIEGKIVLRKKYHVVYIKEGEAIVDLLNIIEAHVALMKLENLRIVKEMRNSINRRVNCEAANITKTVTAATKQIEDILWIQRNYGFENLPDNLRETAEIRLQYPDATLKELGEYLNPPVGKSGVNHRLRKLSEITEERMLLHEK